MQIRFNKAQIAIEYMLLIGLVLLVTLPLIYYSIRESNISVQLNNAEDAVNTLARAADTVYSIGPGTKKYVWLDMPGGVTDYSTANKTVLMKMYIFGGLSDVFAETKADLTGVLPISKGQHRVLVQMLDSGYVQFGEANDTMAPVVIWSSPKGTINYNGIILRATTNEPAVCKYDLDDISYSLMNNNFIGSSLLHEEDMGILDNGNYTYFARCQDPSGNIMEESAIINFTIVPVTTQNGTNGTGGLPQTNETYESDPPIVSLVYPPNNYINNASIIVFQYNVTDNSSIWLCHLSIDNVTYLADYWVERNITQNFSAGGIEYGNHSWNVSCFDVHGNIGSSETRNFTTTYIQDHDSPIVRLVSPPDGTIRNYWLTKFSYNVTDQTSGIAYCNLNMAGKIDQNSSVGWTITDSPVQEGVVESITLPLFKANYTWNISCADNSYLGNIGYSTSWFLVINITAGEDAFLDSCAGYCGYIGYMDGICRQNAGKCSTYIGGKWESGGDTYCPVETGDFCCCVQQTLS